MPVLGQDAFTRGQFDPYPSLENRAAGGSVPVLGGGWRSLWAPGARLWLSSLAHQGEEVKVVCFGHHHNNRALGLCVISSVGHLKSVVMDLYGLHFYSIYLLFNKSHQFI